MLRAVKWYREAAEQGHADAQFNLWVMYTQDDGVPKDYVEFGFRNCLDELQRVIGGSIYKNVLNLRSLF